MIVADAACARARCPGWKLSLRLGLLLTVVLHGHAKTSGRDTLASATFIGKLLKQREAFWLCVGVCLGIAPVPP